MTKSNKAMERYLFEQVNKLRSIYGEAKKPARVKRVGLVFNLNKKMRKLKAPFRTICVQLKTAIYQV